MLSREVYRRLSCQLLQPSMLRAAHAAAAAGPEGDDLSDSDKKFHKMLGISIPAHRELSEDAQRLHDLLRSAPRLRPPKAGAPQQHSSTHVGARRVGAPHKKHFHTSAAAALAERPRNQDDSGVQAASERRPDDGDEDQADRVLEAGSRRLMDTEDGRERLREGSFNIDVTAQSMLEAAAEELGEDNEDAKKAKEAAARIKGGGEDPLAKRVKERTVGLGQTS